MAEDKEEQFVAVTTFLASAPGIMKLLDALVARLCADLESARAENEFLEQELARLRKRASGVPPVVPKVPMEVEEPDGVQDIDIVEVAPEPLSNEDLAAHMKEMEARLKAAQDARFRELQKILDNLG